MTEELLHDLSDYTHNKNKGIMAATRSLIQVFRDLNPALLHRKHRGRDAQMALSVMSGEGDDAERMRQLAISRLEYGAELVHRDVEGVDLLMDAGAIKKDDDWSENIGSFDPDDILDNMGDSEDDESDKKTAPRLQLSKFEIKKLRRKRGKVLKALRAKIYAQNGISVGDDGDEEGNDLIDAALAAADAKREKRIAAGEEVSDDDEDDLDASMLDGEGDEMGEGDFDGWEIDDEDAEMGEGDDEDAELEEDAEEEEEDEEVEESSSKRVKTTDDISNQIVKLADVAPIVPKAAIRILGPADFKKIELLKQRRREEGVRGARMRQKDVLNEDLYNQLDRLTALRMGSYTDVNEDDLTSSHIKRKRLAKEERLAKMKESKDSILAARDYVKFGHQVKKDNLGLSNEEKRNTKNFVMVKHSARVRAKAMRGFKDKQEKTADHIKALHRRGKNLKKGVAKRGRAKAGK
jgi:protein SDA1